MTSEYRIAYLGGTPSDAAKRHPGSLLEFASWLGKDPSAAAALRLSIGLDIFVVVWLALRVASASQGHFGWPWFGGSFANPTYGSTARSSPD